MAFSAKNPNMDSENVKQPVITGTSTDYRRNAIRKRLKSNSLPVDEQTDMADKKKQVGY